MTTLSFCWSSKGAQKNRSDTIFMPTAQLPATAPETKLVTLDPAWDRARQLLAAGRRTACELAAEIERLRAAYQCDKSDNLRRGNTRITQSIGNAPTSQFVTSGNDGGFQAQLRAQLGLHPEQARRIEESAAYQSRIGQVAEAEDGEVISWEEAGTEQSLTVSEAHRQLARQALAGLALPGAPKPSRAWAGIAGEGTRVAQRGGRDRQPINHAMNIAKALTQLQTSLPHWAKISPKERAAIEEGWADIRPLLPPTFLLR